MRASQPQRRRVQPVRAAHAGHRLRPSRNRRGLHPHRPDVAAHQPRAARRLRAPGHHRGPAHHHRQDHYGAARRGNRVSSTPAGLLVCRWRRALEIVAAAAAERHRADIRVVRARPQPGDHPQPSSRGGYQQRGGSWRQLPALPPGTATLAPGPSGGWNALAVHGTQLTIWQASPGAQAWAREQVIKVPVPYGSSG